MTANDRDLTLGQVARICKVSPDTVRSWVAKGLLHANQLPVSGFRRVSAEELAAFLARNPGMGIDPGRIAKFS